MRIADIIRQKGDGVALIAPDAPISEAIATLAQWSIGAVVVSSDGHRIEGILSERDIVRSMVDGSDALTRAVRELMTAEVVTADPDTSVDSLMELMTSRRIRHVPVVEDGDLAGIVSIGDVVKVRVTELERETEQLHDYIATGR